MAKYIALVVLTIGVVAGFFFPVAQDSRIVVERGSDRLGAANTPDLSIGGVRLSSSQTSSLNQATSSVLCALQSPSSTSTLVMGGVMVTTATSGVSSLSLSKSTTNATVGNVLASTSVASGVGKTLELPATTTIGGHVFVPNTYLIVAQQGAGILNQSGTCNAVWNVF